MKYVILVITTCLVAATASATLIASESFSTGQTSGDYVNSTSFNDAANEGVTVGNSGFGTHDWHYGTSFHTPRNNLSAQSKMTNAGVSATSPYGAAYVRVGDTSLQRKSNRQLNAAPTGSSSYFFSGLVMRTAVTSMDVGDEMAMGIGSHVASHDFYTDDGMYIGLYRGADDYKVTAYAGGNRYILQNAGWQVAYQVVLQLDVDLSGNETLNAWVVDAGGELTERLSAQTVETYSSTANLESFSIMSSDAGGAGDNNGVLFDEMRFGTTLSDVTLVPEPATVGMMGMTGLLALLIRRLTR